jgi:hypothetical protein
VLSNIGVFRLLVDTGGWPPKHVGGIKKLYSLYAVCANVVFVLMKHRPSVDVYALMYKKLVD